MDVTNEQTKEFDKEPKKKPTVFTTKCETCGKEGWIGKVGYENGEVKERLFFLIDGKFLCDNCLE